MPIPIGTNATALPVSPSTPSSSGTNRLGKQDFLKLLIAQLQNQDPMKPMEDKEFITQLAQFSSLEAMENLQKSFETFSTAQTLNQVAGLIGKQIDAKLPDGTIVSGTVSQVQMIAGVPKLLVNGKTIEMSQVTSVGGQSTTSAATPKG